MSQPKATGDSVRAYLRDIGRIPLLEHDEEILLGRKVQRLMEIKEIEAEMEVPNQDDLAGILGITSKQLKRELRDGEKAKDKMVTANLRLVVRVSKKYRGRMDEIDLISEGNIGLATAADKYLPGVKAKNGVIVKFSTYAVWWIKQSILRAIANKANALAMKITAITSL